MFRASKRKFFLIGMSALLAPVAVADVVTFETGKMPLVEIHVATTGSDVAGDGTPGSPYASIQRAAQDAAPGSAVRVHPGTYAGGNFVSNLSGTAANPVWIGGVPGQAKPVIDGGSVGVQLGQVRYLVLHDLVVQNASGNGINADDGSDYANPDATRHVVFRDLEVYDIGGTGNQDCLKLSGVDDYWVLDSVFARCGGGNSGSGIDHVGCHGGHIEGNTFDTMSGNSIQTKGGSENILIHANYFIDGGLRVFNIGGSTGFQFFRPPLSTTEPNFEARDIRVTANVIVGSTDAPIAFVGAVDSLAANNTVIDPNQRWLVRILQETVSDGNYTFLECADNTVVNNLFYFDRSLLTTPINIGVNTDAGSFTFANNLWYAHDNPANSQPNLPVVETGGVVGQDPLLESVATGNYHLQANSPAIGKGLALAAVSADFDGRLYNDPPSIGALEGNPPGRFEDVPPDYWAFSFIETLAESGITAGCGNNNYCPTAPVTRAQMAVFLERGINGANYNPPAATGNAFLDVGAGDFAAAWIEQLFADGITAGCGNNNYCPNANVTRAQMAVFLLRAKYGSGYSPPAPGGVFGDVDLGYWAAAWIEQLAAEGITAGCGNGNYCPEAQVTRDQMAVFLVRTFGL